MSFAQITHMAYNFLALRTQMIVTYGHLTKTQVIFCLKTSCLPGVIGV